MPLEIQPLLDAATLDPTPVEVDAHTFYTGHLSGQPVAIGMTGIGLVNADRTVEAAFDHFTCAHPGGSESSAISAVVFSGVAGSVHSIGDVAVPQRWTMDGGATWVHADARMLQAAGTLIGRVDLSDTVPVGDAACLCPGVDTLPTAVQVEHDPQLFVGGDGVSSDMFNGRALPCIPGGGDTFGCRPCMAPGTTPEDVARFATRAPTFADPAFLTEFLQPPGETTDTYEAQDMETAAAAAATDRHGAPFLGIRAVSDGDGDPLGLPGFPFQFFAYRNLAGDNAAAVTIAFLDTWHPAPASLPHRPRHADG